MTNDNSPEIKLLDSMKKNLNKAKRILRLLKILEKENEIRYCFKDNKELKGELNETCHET